MKLVTHIPNTIVFTPSAPADIKNIISKIKLKQTSVTDILIDVEKFVCKPWLTKTCPSYFKEIVQVVGSKAI